MKLTITPQMKEYLYRQMVLTEFEIILNLKQRKKRIENKITALQVILAEVEKQLKHMPQ